MEEYKKRKLQERKAKESLREIIIYSVFIMILMLVAFSTVDKQAYTYQSSLQNLFGVADLSDVRH